MAENLIPKKRWLLWLKLFLKKVVAMTELFLRKCRKCVGIGPQAVDQEFLRISARSNQP